MASMLRDSAVVVVVVVVRTRPREIPLLMVTMRKSIPGFLFPIWLWDSAWRPFGSRSSANIICPSRYPSTFCTTENVLGTGQKVQGGEGVRRTISKCGNEKTHDPPLPFGTKLSDPPLNEG